MPIIFPTLKVLLFLILFPFFIWAFQSEDKILADLENAKKQYVFESESMRKIFFKKIEDQIKITAQSGNFELVQRLLTEKKEFEIDNRKIPMAKEFKAIVVVFQKENKKTKDVLINVYEKAIKELTKKLEIDLAVRIKNEMIDFQKTVDVVVSVQGNTKDDSGKPNKSKDFSNDKMAKLSKEDFQKNEQTKSKEFVNSIGIKFVRVPPGKFVMGSPNDEPDRNSDETLHEVHIKKGFYIGVYEVTQKEWLKLMSLNPSYYLGENHPVAGIRGHMVDEFIKRLINKENKKYSLPTEEQWEYACRAGTKTPFSFGKMVTEELAHIDFSKKSNSALSGQRVTHLKPVGSFPPNPWGIYDMHGGVFEVCKDLYKPYIQGEEFPKEYYERIEEGIRYRTRVYRGGNNVQPAHFARSAARYYWDYTGESHHGGFRLVLNDD